MDLQYIKRTDLLSIEEVFERWHMTSTKTERLINNIVSEYGIKSYYISDIRKNGDEIICICGQYNRYLYSPNISFGCGVYFLKSEIESTEEAMPHLVWEPVSPQEQGLDGAQARARVVELEQQLAEAQGEIASLKEERAGHSAQAQDKDGSQAEAQGLEREAHARRQELAAAQGRIAELEQQLAQVQDRLKDALEGHGLLSEVLKRKLDGEPWDTTKVWLESLGLSASNIGMFLREKILGDEGYRAAGRNGKPQKR